MAAGLEQTGNSFKVVGPVFTAHGFNHFDATNGIKRRINRGFTDVAVVLQSQIGLSPRASADTQAGHACIGPVQLFGAQSHADQRRFKFGGCHFSQCTPAAANFKHTIAWLDARHLQRTAYFGVLAFFKSGLWRLKNGR